MYGLLFVVGPRVDTGHPLCAAQGGLRGYMDKNQINNCQIFKLKKSDYLILKFM